MQNVPVTNYHDLSTQKNSESRGKKTYEKEVSERSL